MKQLKILFPLCFLVIVCFGANLYFQSYSIGNTAQKIATGNVTFQRPHIINTSTTSVYVKFYDFAPTGTLVPLPTHTVNPKYVFAVNASDPSIGYVSQIQPLFLNSTGSKSVMTFTAGCYVRCVQGIAPTNTVTPLDSVYLEIDY